MTGKGGKKTALAEERWTTEDGTVWEWRELSLDWEMRREVCPDGTVREWDRLERVWHLTHEYLPDRTSRHWHFGGVLGAKFLADGALLEWDVAGRPAVYRKDNMLILWGPDGETTQTRNVPLDFEDTMYRLMLKMQEEEGQGRDRKVDLQADED